MGLIQDTPGLNQASVSRRPLYTSKMMGIFEIISLVLNLAWNGGLWVTVVTLKSVKKEASAKAKAVAEVTGK